MITVALIGGDGAGKTTVTRKLLAVSPCPTKYLYMGMSTRSSNFALPTSKIAHWFKLRRYKKSLRKPGAAVPEEVARFYEENRGPDTRGKFLATLRLFNRLAEEIYRLLIVWSYQSRGYMVLFDRHFLFDFAERPDRPPQIQNRLSERLHRWFLQKVYPKPDLTIFLDAPPEVLIQRKGEANVAYLSAKREAYFRQGMQTPNFVKIDATQSPQEVFAEVIFHINRTINAKYPGKANLVHREEGV